MMIPGRQRATGPLSVAASLALALLLAAGVAIGEPRDHPSPKDPETSVTAPLPAIPELARIILPPPPPSSQAAPPPLPRIWPSEPEVRQAVSSAAEPPVVDPAPADPAPADPTPTTPKPQVTPLAPLNTEPPPESLASKNTAPDIRIDSTRATSVSSGRALLRMLEIGKGPGVEIAWPEARAERNRLFQAFQSCLGMQVALMTPDNRLFTRQTPPGQAATIETDRVSQFLRSPSGEIPAAEAALHRKIISRHKLARAQPVRLLPRNVDAALLGGLFDLLGSDYRPGSIIRARYRLLPGSLAVEDISIDGRRTDGRMSLSLSLLRRCRS